jgi:hypothetical protein
MAFLKYSDLPVFANFTQENIDPVKSNASFMFAATEASLNLDTNLAITRYLGTKKAEMPASGPLEGKFTLTFFPMIESTETNSILNIQKTNQLAFFNLTGDFALGHTISLSNFNLRRSYLQNYSIKINPYQPVSIQANFISYDIQEIIGKTLSSQVISQPISKDTSKPNYEALHGLTTLMTTTSNSTPQTKTSIEVQVDCNRTPIYPIGSKIPDGVVLNTVERTINIQGENIGSVIDITGSSAGNMSLYFSPLSKLGSSISSNSVYTINTVDAKITAQQLSISQNSTLNGKVVIKEIIL